MALLGESYYVLTLEKAPPLFYAALAGGMILNLVNAVALSRKSDFENVRKALVLIRAVSVITYPALLWGFLCSVFFLLGPKRNEHMLFLITLSLPVLNLSGAFYSVPLILHLRKEQKIGILATVFYIIFSFIIGADIFAAFSVRNK